MSWIVTRHKAGEKTFGLIGYGYVLRGEVWRGAMKDDTYWGIKALEHPHARERVIHNWTAPMRRQVGVVPNTGENRVFVILEAPDAAQVVLRFDQTVPPELLRDLREAFAGPQARAKEIRHEEPHPDPQLDPPDPARGHRPGLDEDPAREAAEARPGARRQGLEEVAPAPAKRKKKPRRKTSGNAKSNGSPRRPRK